ncbi:uncharacterized protein [Dermacentor andersoni]|uniref:uncharacterized protein n=1 Tax=Dermacentor andersoni TaxID=34620 RepID=UPI003B3A2806
MILKYGFSTSTTRDGAGGTLGTTQDVHFSAPSQLPEVTQTQATSGTRLYHCSAAEIASTSGFATAVSQHVGDNAYEIIGPDDESPQGANDISVAEVSPIPLEVTMTDDTAVIDTESACLLQLQQCTRQAAARQHQQQCQKEPHHAW